MREAVTEVTQRLVADSAEATRAVRASASEASTVLGRAISEIEGMFGARANSVTEALELRTREFNDVLGARSGELAALLDSRSNSLLRTLEQRGSELVEAVISRSDEASRTLLESGERVASSFVTTNDKLRREVAEIAERLSHSNELLNSLLASTSDNLEKIETQLNSGTAEFRAAIGHAVEATQLSSTELTGQVTNLRGVSKDIIEGVGAVVKRFEEQGSSLAGASRTLAEINRQIQSTVEERRPALEQLTSSLKQRSEELDGLMKSFTRIISETLKTAEERAAAVSRMLTENTAAATKGVIENFETMNRTAGTESRKASEAVREANKTLIAEMGQAISEASKRFSEATREMRQATQQLQQDLETTREEVRRGVLEIPEEAREGAEAMRRVVGDQIKALSELSEIISRHGKTLDLSSPALGEPRVAVGAESYARVPEIDTPASAARNGARSAGPTAPRGGQRTPVPRNGGVKPAPTEGVEDGWVSDLLRRASNDEEAATPTVERRQPEANGAACYGGTRRCGFARRNLGRDRARHRP